MFKSIKQWLAQQGVEPKKPHSPLGMEISYSKLKSYLNCPWLYRILYVEFKRPTPTPQSAFGQSIHRALEAYHREDASTLERLLEFYAQYWVHAGYPSPQLQMEWYERGERLLERYWNLETARRSKIVYVEKEFFFPLGFHQVRGMIDRVDLNTDGQYEVIDYKTHQNISTEEEASRDVQLAMYGLGIKEGLGIRPAYLTLFYVATGRRVTVPYDSSREEALKERIKEVADHIVSGNFAPNTAFCQRCDFRKTCPHSVAKESER